MSTHDHMSVREAKAHVDGWRNESLHDVMVHLLHDHGMTGTMNVYREHSSAHGFIPEDGPAPGEMEEESHFEQRGPIHQDGHTRWQLATHFVDQCGFPTTDTNVDQMMVYLEAFGIFIERNQQWKDLWAEYGWMDSIQHIRSKTARLMRRFWGPTADEDDASGMDSALDLINYIVFFIRNLRGRNKWGRS